MVSARHVAGDPTFHFQERRSFQFVAKDKPQDNNVFFKKEYVYGVDGRCNAGYGLWQLAYASTHPLNDASHTLARASMGEMRGDYEHVLGIKGTTMVVPGALEKAGRQLINADRDAYGATNVGRARPSSSFPPGSKKA